MKDPRIRELRDLFTKTTVAQLPGCSIVRSGVLALPAVHKQLQG